jgi:hypothetical protein
MTVGKLEQATRLAILDSPATMFIGRVRYCSRDELGRASAALRKGEGKDVASEVANGLHMPLWVESPSSPPAGAVVGRASQPDG